MNLEWNKGYYGYDSFEMISKVPDNFTTICFLDPPYNKKKDKRYKHPGQTSISITEKFIKYFTNENDKVIDPFLGTGTTGYICSKFKRNWMGFELNKEYKLFLKDRLFILEQEIKNIFKKNKQKQILDF